MTLALKEKSTGTTQEPSSHTGWTPETQKRGQAMGREAIALKAKELRALWRREAVKLIVDNYDSGNYIFRESIVSGLHSFCFAYGFKGKGGGNLQTSTISRWLTREVEAAIRLEAMKLIAKGGTLALR